MRSSCAARLIVELVDAEQGDIRPYAKYMLDAVKRNKDAADSDSLVQVHPLQGGAGATGREACYSSTAPNICCSSQTRSRNEKHAARRTPLPENAL